MWNPDGETSAEPLKSELRIRTPEENFKFTFLNSPPTREAYGIRVLNGKLIVFEPDKLAKTSPEKRQWVLECYQKWNQGSSKT